jgi:hydroxypyruvate reductase
MSLRCQIAVLGALPADLMGAYHAVHDPFVYNPAGEQQPGVAILATSSIRGATAQEMAGLPDLALILCQGTGLDKIDLDEAQRRAIKVVHTPDIMTDDVADFAVALIYTVMRRIVEADKFIRSGMWSGNRMANSVRVGGRIAGIFGMGKIGQAIARRLSGIGMNVRWFGPNPKPDLPWQRAESLAALAEMCDVLIISTPGGPETENAVSAEILQLLGPQGYLINVARGSVVDEAALLDALENRQIAGAGLDVFVTEPALDPRFLVLDNAVLTPHYASLTNEVRADIIKRFLDAIDRWHADPT